jgi:hypothetical protein
MLLTRKGEWTYSSTYSWSRHWINVSGHLHTLAALAPEKESPFTHWKEALWTPVPVWTLLEKIKVSCGPYLARPVTTNITTTTTATTTTDATTTTTTTTTTLLLATGCTVRGSYPCGGKRFYPLHTRPDQPWGPTSLLYNGYRGSCPGCALTINHHLAPRLRMGRATTLPPPPTTVPSWHAIGWSLPLLLLWHDIQISGPFLEGVLLWLKCSNYAPASTCKSSHSSECYYLSVSEVTTKVSSILRTPLKNFGEHITCVPKFISFLNRCSNSHNDYNVFYFKNLQFRSPNLKNKGRNTKHK